MQALNRYAVALGLLATSSFALSASDRMEDGRKAYDAGCAKCHKHGSLGAPVTSKPEDWADRSDLWEGVLFEHASKGYIDMPAKGGDQGVSDYDLEAAAEYMLTITYPEMPAD